MRYVQAHQHEILDKMPQRLVHAQKLKGRVIWACSHTQVQIDPAALPTEPSRGGKKKKNKGGCFGQERAAEKYPALPDSQDGAADVTKTSLANPYVSSFASVHV